MLTGALRHIDVRFVSFLVIFSLLTGTALAKTTSSKMRQNAASSARTTQKGSKPSGAPVEQKSDSAIRDWGPYLDVAQQMTYWNKPEIKEWRIRQEKELGQPLETYIAQWNKKLAAPGADIVRGEDQQPLYKERDYLRLAIAQTIDYLQDDNRNSLDGADRILEKLKYKTSMPEIAYWTGFVKALQAMENNDSDQFVTQVYNIWNNAITYIEQSAISEKTAKAAKSRKAPFHYRNLVNLVVNRAIIDRKLPDLNALGPLFIMLKQRDLEENETEGKYLTTLVERITDGFVAPDSDRYRLNFTVATIEAKRLQQIAAAKIDSEGMTEEAHKIFQDSRTFDDYAIKWAQSRRSSGAVTAVIEYLDTTSFAIERLSENQNAPAYKFFVMLPSHDGLSTLLKAMAVYNDVATYTDGGWEKAGYADRKSYLQSVHRLWRAFMELSLWTGDFYLMQLSDTTDPQTIFAIVPPMQVVLNSYLDFLITQKKRGLPDVIPDFAYFGAAEASEKLAFGYIKTSAYSTDNTAYNLWFLYRLQSTEMFPFNPKAVSQTADILRSNGRYNLYLDYYLPMAERFKKSKAVHSWLKQAEPGETTNAIRNYMAAINKVFDTMQQDAADKTTQREKEDPSFVASFRKLRQELQREPDHPVHKLLRDFYLEETQNDTNYTLLLQNSNRLNQGL